jgi:hypoxanthine phosphoribosyltransferase
MRLNETPIVTAAQIERRIVELAGQISRDYAGRDVLLIAVLKGSIVFASDLMRRLTIPIALDFVRARSYRNAESTGHVECTYLPEQSVAGKHVLLIEDILDTGRTASAVVRRINKDSPASLAVCALFDKPSRRSVPIPADYVGFTLDDQFVVGYGLDYNEHGRELPDLHVLDTG